MAVLQVCQLSCVKPRLVRIRLGILHGAHFLVVRRDITSKAVRVLACSCYRLFTCTSHEAGQVLATSLDPHEIARPLNLIGRVAVTGRDQLARSPAGADELHATRILVLVVIVRPEERIVATRFESATFDGVG